MARYGDRMPSDDSGYPAPRDLGDHWALPLGLHVDGEVGEVDQLRIDYAFTLVISGLVEIRIGTEFAMGSADGEVVYDPEDTASLGPLLTLHKAEVSSVTVSKAGVVRVEFVDGRMLRVEPHEQYESCAVNLNGPRGGRRYAYVVMPGGGLAEFSFED